MVGAVIDDLHQRLPHLDSGPPGLPEIRPQRTLQFAAALVYLAGKPQTSQLVAHLHNRARLLENLWEMRAPRGLNGWNACLAAYRELLDRIEVQDAVLACRALDDLLAADGQAALHCL